jgi:hypothetical protein
MSFIARLGTDVIAVETGATTPLTVEIVNRSDESDQFELVIEGLDPDWTAVPVPVVTIEGRETQQEKVFFKPPRVSDSSAGNYPFVLKVRSLTSGESRNVQGVLSVKPYDHLSLEINPKKGVLSPAKKLNRFDANLVNLGNTEHTVQLFGSDPEEACAFEFDQQQVTLGPGQQRTVRVTVNPTGNRVPTSSRLYGFTISARSLESPSVGAIAQAQLEQRPLLSLGAVVFAAIVVVLAALWIAFIPKPPTLELNVDKTTVDRGQPVVISWRAGADATSVRIRAQGQTIYEGAERNGNVTFVANPPPGQSTVEVSGYSDRDGKESPTRRQVIQVTEPPVIQPPTIETFDVEPKTAEFGGKVLVSYLVHNASEVQLQPMGKSLPVLNDQQNQLEVEIDSMDLKTLTLVATNSKGQSARKEIKIRVVKASKAKILAFTADPPKLPTPSGSVVVSWQANDLAVRTELKVGDQVYAVNPKDSRTLMINAATKVTLTCFDNEGVPDTRTLTIGVTPPPPPSTGTDIPSTGPETTTTTTGGPSNP